MSIWNDAKQAFIDSGAGVLAQILYHHPSTLLSKSKRLAFFDDGVWSAAREVQGVAIYFNPTQGQRIKMPQEASLEAGGIANEYKLAPPIRAVFEQALANFVESGVGHELVFNRDGTTSTK